MYFVVITYYLEKPAVAAAHKKYTAHGTSKFAMIHGMGSCVELTLGLAAVLRPENPWLAKATAYLALGVNLPTGWMLTPRVFGVKHLTVPGFGVIARQHRPTTPLAQDTPMRWLG